MARKISEREILRLSENEIQKIERVNKSIEKKENAIASKESQMKLRTLFERAPEETLAFIVYCIYIGSAGMLGFLYIITKFQDTLLYTLLILLALLMILPLFILPKFSLKKFFLWLSDLLSKRRN